MTFRTTAFSLACAAVLGLMAAAPAAFAEDVKPSPSGSSDQAETLTLWTLASRSGRFRQFLHGAKMAGLEDDLKGQGPLTVLAPNDAAFGKLPNGVWFKLLEPENRDLLRELIRFHLVPGHYPPQRLLNASAKYYDIPGAGGPILIDIRKGDILVQGHTADAEFLAADGGLLMPIDGVLLPKGMIAKLEALK